VEVYLYEIPVEGKIIILVGECSTCGYRHRDVFPAEQKNPMKIELPVETEEDLESFVFRSYSADVEIPELGIEVVAGALYQGVITTVRGLLETFLTALGSNCGDKCNEIMEAMEGKRKFTLIIKDKSGLSYVLNKKAKVTPL
jgi:zinc finger protein